MSRNDGGRTEPNFADIARTARVSTGPVSHAITGRLRVSPATRECVDQAIAVLCYRPANE